MLMMRIMKKIKPNQKLKKRIVSLLLMTAMMSVNFAPAGPKNVSVQTVYGASRLKLSSVKSIAVAQSEKIESLDIQIEAKRAAKSSAVRALREREENMQTFRWSPLLNFKFPTRPNEGEAFEFAFKPMQLEYNINRLEHKIIDEKLKEYEKVSNLYIDIITYTAEITFLKSRIQNMSVAVLKNKARVVEGTATQKQVDQQEKTLEGLKKSLTKQKSKLLKAQQKLGKRVGFKVTTGYKFDEEFIGTNMNHDTIEYLQNFAIENDQTVYESRIEMQLAELTLAINYNLMRNEYGNDINMISGYIDQVRQGSSVDKRAFRKDYDKFLKKIDEPWQGAWRILFFSIPKVWLKGDLDGIRYVEDDPYVLYTAALDYEAAIKEYNNTCDDLRESIEDGYDALIDARQAYMDAKDALAQSRADLLNSEARNAVGTLTFEEYESAREDYEACRSGLKEALSTYSKSLYSFDRTTCGSASIYFAEESLTTQTGAAGLGTPEDKDGADADLRKMNAVIEKGATYSIRSIVDSQEFMLYVDVPENFEYKLTDFELWADGRQIGSRTAIGESIRHMVLTVQDSDSVFVRLYNGTEFVDDCAIDPKSSYGPLNITARYEINDTENLPVIGSYTVEDDPNLDRIKLRFQFDQSAVKREYQMGAEVVYYNVAAEKSLYLFSNDLIEVENAFSYMSFIKNDIGKLTLRLFDNDGNYIGGAKFNTDNNTVYVDKDVTLEDMQEMAARQLLIEEKSADLVAEKNRLTDLYNAARSVNSSEADSASVAYYKAQLEKIQKKLDAVGDAITDEEIAQALAQREDEIAKRVSEMGGEDGSKDGAQALSAEEEAARDAILDAAAREYIKKLRTGNSEDSLNSAIEDKQKEIKEKYRQYLDAQENGDDALAEDLKLEMDNLQKEIDVYNNKKAFLDSDDRSISDEEVSQALLEFGDQIYALAADELSDDMLYGSPTGQWAKAYLETRGLETSVDNMREIIANAEDYQEYEYLLNRRDILKKEMENAKKLSERLKDTNDAVDSSCSAQVDTIVENYKKQIAKVNQDIKKKDPGRNII